MEGSRSSWLVVVLLLIGSLTFLGQSCAGSIDGKAYDSLNIAATAYDTTMTYFGDEYKAGRLTEEQKTQVVDYAEKYRLAHSAARSALKEYIKLKEAGSDGTLDQEEILSSAMSTMLEASKILSDYVNKGGGD